MANSEVSICNLAIARVGGTTISALSENVKTAKLCTIFYPNARDSVLAEDVWWTFATKRATLAQLATDPASEFDNAFQLPSDLLLPRYVVDGDEVEYDIEVDTLVTDATEIKLVYTFQQTDPAKFTQLFVEAVALRIAADLALPITNDKNNQANFLELYKQQVSKARKADTRKKHRKISVSSRWVNARISGGAAQTLPKKLTASV